MRQRIRDLRAKVLTLLLAIAGFVGAASEAPTSDNRVHVGDSWLLHLAKDPTNLVRVTSGPITLSPWIEGNCAPLPTSRTEGHYRVTGKRGSFIHVYVTPDGSNAMKVASASFPPGAIILKQKFPHPMATMPELYTGMIKHEKGYNKEGGDWEFFTLSGDAKAVTSRGRIESCIGCHTYYRATDFVTKRY